MRACGAKASEAVFLPAPWSGPSSTAGSTSRTRRGRRPPGRRGQNGSGSRGSSARKEGFRGTGVPCSSLDFLLPLYLPFLKVCRQMQCAETLSLPIPTLMARLIDTTSDTTQGATPRNSGQPPEKKTASICRFCNIQQPLEARVSGLWL
jgi:hypothetical protein